MTINVTEPYYTENLVANFYTDNGVTKLLYWGCDHYIQGNECIYCALAVEGDE